MHIDEINLEQLDKFNVSRSHSQITQSRVWAEVLGAEGRTVAATGLFAGEELRAAWLTFRQDIGGGFYYQYSPRPDLSGLSEEELEFLFSEMKKTADPRQIFWRFDPLFDGRISNLKLVPTISVQPKQTCILDISLSQEELLEAMHQKTRYNIRLAGKKGVTVRRAGADDFAAWWQLMQSTVERDGFRLHGQEHYRTLLSKNSEQIDLWVAEYGGRIICGNIMSWYGDTVSYLHGASANEYRNVMAPYALQWHLIREAKRRRFRYYDLNGIDEQKWPGVTRFKRGFGGAEATFSGTFDLVFKPVWYQAYSLLRQIRRKLGRRGK